MNKIYFAFIFFLQSFSLIAQESDTTFISSARCKAEQIYLAGYEESVLWKYHPGDDSSWAEPDFDDTDWKKTDPTIDVQMPDAEEWKGIGWFRKVIKIDSPLVNTILGFHIEHEGASEIYLNGRKIFTFGKVSADRNKEIYFNPEYSPYVLSFDTSLVYTIAVRYSNHSYIGWKYIYNKFFNHLGFSISIYDFNEKYRNELQLDRSTLIMDSGLNGFAYAFSLIFFLLYFFYSKKRVNLYFALFVLGIGIFLTASEAQYAGAELLQLIAAYRFLMFVGVSFIFSFFLLFIYQIVYGRIIKLFWLFIVAFSLVNLIAFFGTEGIFSYMTPLGIIIGIMSIESIRVFIIGILRKIEYAPILFTGSFLFLLITLASILLPLMLPPSTMKSLETSLVLMNIIVLPVSMAIYLAKSYARANNDLEEQIVNVKKLSEKQLEQERKNADLQLRAELESIENKRKSEELEQARNLQLSMLPQEIPSIPGLDIAVFMRTATQVGGDYYDFYKDESGILTVVIGDATGHGLNAGMMVSVTKGLFQSLISDCSLEDLTTRFNYSLLSMKLQPMYMALFVLRINKSYIEVIGAGMHPSFIYRKSTRVVTEIESSGPPLGGIVNPDYVKSEFKLSAGDVILLLTDGCTERFNEKGEILGSEKAKEILKNSADKNSDMIIGDFVKACDEWGGSRPQDDDITFVAIKLK